MRFAALFLLPGILSAQLVTNTAAIPKGSNPPVVFVNGYQATCPSDFSSTFNTADKVLQASNIVSVFFDNCSAGGVGAARPSIEAEGVAFGQFLAGLKYADGTAVTQVDVIVHSMGGLILRAYLAGMKETNPVSFQPPATVPIRKAIFLATPHFGTSIAALFGGDKQTTELSPGSQFLFDLNTWNQGADDLRGIDAIAVIGNGGNGKLYPGNGAFDDGVVTLTSGSLGFYRPGVTRVLPDCHTFSVALVFGGYCSSATPSIVSITTDAANPVSQIITSFLTGTNAWKTVGQTPESQTSLAGLLLQLHDKDDVVRPVAAATVGTPPANLSLNGPNQVYSEVVAGSNPALSITPVGDAAQASSVSLSAARSLAVTVKPGPRIFPKGVVPAAGPAPVAYDVSAGAYVSIYGVNLAGGATQSATPPYPEQLAGVQVLVDNKAAQVVFVTDAQINFVYPTAASAISKLTVKNANGQHTVNIRVAPAVPSIFLIDGNSSAAARNALTSAVVTTSTPLRAGDFLSLYLTGLGPTTTRDGLEYADLQPTITIGGKAVNVAYAGRTPGFAGLDQINCQIPAGLTGDALPVVVTSGTRVSNTAFIAIR